ncbi:MAG: hypothetical protein AAB276_07530 [Pseudomonadota bacterium]
MKLFILACVLSLFCISNANAADVFVELELDMPDILFERNIKLPDVDGVMVNVDWNSLEPTAGQYVWTDIDRVVAVAASTHKKIGFHFYTTYKMPAPMWLKDLGAQAYIAPSSKKGGPNAEDIVPWNTVLIKRWGLLLAALSKHLVDTGTSQYVSYVMEGHDRGSTDVRGCQSGYIDITRFDKDLYVAASVNKIKALLAAFPQSKVMMLAPPLHICGGDEAGAAHFKQVMDGLGNDAKRLVIFAADFTAKGSARLNNIKDLLKGHDIAMEPIWAASTDRYKTLEGPFDDVICRASNMYQPIYVQPYLQDLSDDNKMIKDIIHAVHLHKTAEACNNADYLKTKFVK